MKKPNIKINKEKLNKFIKGFKFVLVIVMIILIYMVSPKITVTIQNMAKFIYELEGVYITRVVELILAVACIVTIYTAKKEVK